MIKTTFFFFGCAARVRESSETRDKIRNFIIIDGGIISPKIRGFGQCPKRCIFATITHFIP
jgi:hypothetical protein